MVRLTIFAILLLSLVSVCLSEDDSDEAVVTEEIDDVVPDEEIVYVSPTPSGNTYLAEHFDDEGRFKQKWIVSEAKKDDMDEEISKYEGMWAIEPPQQDGLKGDLGLVLKSKAKHSAISARLDRPFVFADKPFIVQYEVAFQEGQDCGGAYLKLLSQSKQSSDLRKFNDKTPYTIMFGPDKCGTDVKIINEGNLLEDFTPPVNPPAEIEDPSDKKPEDWDEREKIADPEAKKPDDWDEDAPPMIPDESAVKPDGWLEDEPEMIPDPNAEKPDDWDTDMDGEWEAPLISNPACEGAPGCGPWKRPMINNPAHKGKWRPPLIDNPNYKGKWKPRRIPNPDFYEDLQPFKMTRDCNYGQVSNMIFVLTILL
ncbi:Uncharacterized protein GBIM_05208 [Gryllus bimaculatus]|nr:Uncharacterized protein GBIM_05208 [Gryllus bimaculatus]